MTLQFVRREHLGWYLLVPGGGPLKRTPGPVDALPLVPCRTEPVLKIRAVGLIVVNGKWSCDYTDQGMAARHRALDRGYRGSRPPQPRDQSLHRSNKRRYFQYAVCSTVELGPCQHRSGPALDRTVTLVSFGPAPDQGLGPCPPLNCMVAKVHFGKKIANLNGFFFLLTHGYGD